MDHPLDMLLINKGQLLQRIATNLKHAVPYMDTGEVEIRGKGNPKSVAEPAGYGEYPFELNTSPDPVWRKLFSENIRLNQDAQPVFKTKWMVVVCDPVNLKRFYQDIKHAMDKTNAAYKIEREQVIKRVEREMAKQESEEKRKAGEEQKVRRAFDELEL
ncbi:MAG: hypothetical protein WB586_11920 [Chthoniobacterales bacterium]